MRSPVDRSQRDRRARDHPEQCRRLLDRAGQRPDVVARRREREDPVERYEPRRRLESDDAAVGGRDPDRAAGVGAERTVAHARRDECGRAAARPARRSALVPRVERHPVRRIHASGRVLEQVRLAEELGAGRSQPRDDGCVALGRRRDAHRRGVRRDDAAHVDVVLDGDDGAVQRPVRRPLSGRQHRDHRVQPRLPLLATRVRGEQLEVRDLADPAAGLDLADQLHRPPHERPVESVEDGLGLPLAHREIAVDARVRLRRPPVELDEALDRALEIGGVEAVERLRAGRRRGEHLLVRRGGRAGDSAAPRGRPRSRDRTRPSRTASPRRPPSTRDSRRCCPSRARRRSPARVARPARSAGRRLRRCRRLRGRRNGCAPAPGSPRRN